MPKNVTGSKGIDEPTLGEVLAVMNEQFSLIDQRFSAADAISRSMNERMDGFDARLGDLQRVQRKLVDQVADIQDDLTSALGSSDKDALTIIDHERRIARLEKASA